MPRSLKRALVRGRPATHWRHHDGCLILRGPRPGEETEVPVAHLVDADEFLGHVMRLEEKRWVPREAIDELREIQRGAAR